MHPLWLFIIFYAFAVSKVLTLGMHLWSLIGNFQHLLYLKALYPACFYFIYHSVYKQSGFTCTAHSVAAVCYFVGLYGPLKSDLHFVYLLLSQRDLCGEDNISFYVSLWIKSLLWQHFSDYSNQIRMLEFCSSLSPFASLLNLDGSQRTFQR